MTRAVYQSGINTPIVNRYLDELNCIVFNRKTYSLLTIYLELIVYSKMSLQSVVLGDCYVMYHLGYNSILICPFHIMLPALNATLNYREVVPKALIIVLLLISFQTYINKKERKAFPFPLAPPAPPLKPCPFPAMPCPFPAPFCCAPSGALFPLPLVAVGNPPLPWAGVPQSRAKCPNPLHLEHWAFGDTQSTHSSSTQLPSQLSSGISCLTLPGPSVWGRWPGRLCLRQGPESCL